MNESNWINGIENYIAKIYLSYHDDDEETVSSYRLKISSEKYEPWMRSDIFVGERKENAINKQLKSANFFIVFLSEKSIDGDGPHKKEINQALEIAKGKSPDDIYFIPALIEECELPDYLSDYQHVCLYKKDGMDRLNKAIEEGIRRYTRGQAAVSR